MDNRFIIRNHNLRNLQHFEAVLQKMSIPMKGVCILLDDNEEPAYGNPIYKRACYMNIKTDGIEERSPQHILEIMYSPECEHFVWVSPSISNSEEFHATWVFAHELQHLNQNIRYPDLSTVGKFIKRVLPQVLQSNSLNQLDVPAELDAELQGKRIAVNMFGDNSYAEYLDRQIAEFGETAKRYHSQLSDLATSYSGDLKQETIRLLCAYKQQFIEQHHILRGSGLYEGMNIEQICGGS